MVCEQLPICLFSTLTGFLSDITTFLATLDKCDGAIMGSITLALFQPRAYTLWQPRNLNLAVPWRRAKAMAQFLRSIGFARIQDYTIPFRWYHLIRRHQKFKKDGCPNIFISEGYHDSALPIILGTSSTATMNAITSTTYYSFYPDLTRLREVVSNWRGAVEGEYQKYKDRGYIFHDHAPRLDQFRCGQGCGLEARRVRGRRGIGVFEWQDKTTDSYRFDEDPIIWQLGESCPYYPCQNRIETRIFPQR